LDVQHAFILPTFRQLLETTQEPKEYGSWVTLPIGQTLLTRITQIGRMPRIFREIRYIRAVRVKNFFIWQMMHTFYA